MRGFSRDYDRGYRGGMQGGPGYDRGFQGGYGGSARGYDRGFRGGSRLRGYPADREMYGGARPERYGRMERAHAERPRMSRGEYGQDYRSGVNAAYQRPRRPMGLNAGRPQFFRGYGAQNSNVGYDPFAL